jgi:hypothetical protein
MHISIDPLTREEFTPKRKNQRFATADNRRKYHNDKATLVYRDKAPIDKKLKHNFLLLNELLKEKKDVMIRKEELLIKGFDPNYFTHITQTNGNVIGNHNYIVFGNQEYIEIGNNKYIVFGNKSADKSATRNTELCGLN